ncbi:MAG: dockerin type I repeat-containing protein, partial [Ruminococcus sp.]|nr:dockerin type I repeat-containing protein [Ruminococcus sp.]
AVNIAEGTKLKLTANAPETGKVFDHWQIRYTITCTKANSYGATRTSTHTCEYYPTTDNPITVTASPDGKQWIAQVTAGSTGLITTFTGRVTIEPVYVDATYKLTLVGCKASKTEGIKEGESVTITPNTPEEGYIFSYWKASTGESLNGDASKLVYTMPAQDVTVTAVFEKVPTYKITATDCTAYLGSTDTEITYAEENQVVRLVAAQPPQGYGFVEWAASNSSVKFYSADSKSAFFAMPPVNVTVYPVFAPLEKHKTNVTVTNYGSAGDYADVTVNEGYMGDTATVKIAFKNGTYSINKISAYYQNGSMTPSVPLTKVGDTTYTFTYPDYDVELVIRVDVMKVNDDPLDITVSDTLSDDFEGDKVRYNELLAFVEYFKSAGKASYTVSGGKYYVDLDKNGSNDIIIDSSDMTVSKASTSSLPKIFTYTADEAAVKFMTDYLAKNDIWILRKTLKITTKPTINAKSLGTQTIDLTSGSYQMTKEKDMSLMAALELLLNEGLIGTDESLQSIDLNNDGIFDLKIVMDLSLAKLSVLKPIGDSYTLALNDTMKSRVKAMIEGVELTEYYDGFRFVFKESTGKPGDANEDGEVDVQDVLLIQQYIAGWNVNINLKNANVNGDTEADIQDCLLIQQHIAGWNVTLV